jgi:hypothetical protein
LAAPAFAVFDGWGAATFVIAQAWASSPQMRMAPGTPEPSKTWCYGTLSKFSIGQKRGEVKLLAGRLSLRFLPDELLLHR